MAGGDGAARLDVARGLPRASVRDRVVAHSKIRRPDAEAYHGGYEGEGYASSVDAAIGDVPPAAVGPKA